MNKPYDEDTLKAKIKEQEDLLKFYQKTTDELKSHIIKTIESLNNLTKELESLKDERSCKNCGILFIPQRQGEFCTEKCYKAWWKREVYNKNKKEEK